MAADEPTPAAPPSAPTPKPAEEPKPAAAAAPEEPTVAVQIETDEAGCGSADVEVNGFDVLDAYASDGSDGITWNVLDPFTTRVSLQDAKTISGTVTVTLKTK